MLGYIYRTGSVMLPDFMLNFTKSLRLNAFLQYLNECVNKRRIKVIACEKISHVNKIMLKVRVAFVLITPDTSCSLSTVSLCSYT